LFIVTIRIQSGIFRGRNLKAPVGFETRPTQSKLRDAVWNSLQAYLPDAKVLDLFCGSGAVGFEALSRGASEAVFVDSSKKAIAVLRENIELLKVADQAKVFPAEWKACLDRVLLAGPFDVVYADPPYKTGEERALLVEVPWEKLLQEDAVFGLETGIQHITSEKLKEYTPETLEWWKEKEYGETRITFWKRRTS
jgi:16S rRNA (guanine966-N2)-methyltransferase